MKKGSAVDPIGDLRWIKCIKDDVKWIIIQGLHPVSLVDNNCKKTIIRIDKFATVEISEETNR